MSQKQDYSKLATDAQIAAASAALKSHTITVSVVDDRNAAKELALSLLPAKAQVMAMTSITLEETGIAEAISTSESLQSVHALLKTMNRETDGQRMQELGAAPEWSIGSVHAITEDGKIVIASNTGSQLPAYAYGSGHVIFVVGTQKIVPTMSQAMERLDEYVIPLESARARKAYGLPESFHTAANKLLIISSENIADRIHVIFVKEKLGY